MLFFKSKPKFVERRKKDRKSYTEIVSPLKTIQAETALFLSEQEGFTNRLTREIQEREKQVQASVIASLEAGTFMNNLKTMFTRELTATKPKSVTSKSPQA